MTTVAIERYRPTARLPWRQLAIISVYWFGISATRGAVGIFGQHQVEVVAGSDKRGVLLGVIATAAFGERIWRGFAAAAVKTALEILDGKDPGGYPRYMTYLKKLPQYRLWIDSSMARDSLAEERLSAWLARRPR